MKIEINENNNRLTYKVNGRELPMNSAIREYKHPSEIDEEGWRDLVNESNGDTLEVTYVGTDAGFKQATAQAPLVSTTFSLKFINIFDQRFLKFQTNFEKWIANLKTTKAYKFAGEQAVEQIDFKALQDNYSAVELGKQLNNLGSQLLDKLLPEKMDNVAEALAIHKEKLKSLSAKQENLERALRTIEDESEKGLGLEQNNTMIQKIESQFVEELVVTITDIDRKMETSKKFINKVVQPQADNEIVTDTKYHEVVGQIILDLQNSLEDFWTAMSEIDSDVENGPFPRRSVEKILNNVSTGKAQVMDITLEDEPFKDRLFIEKTTKTLEHAHQLLENGTLKSQVVEVLFGNALRLVVYLAQVTLRQVIVTVENIQKKQAQLAEQKREQEVLQKRETINQQMVALNQELTREGKLSEWLSSILELKRSMPVMPELEEEKNEN